MARASFASLRRKYLSLWQPYSYLCKTLRPRQFPLLVGGSVIDIPLLPIGSVQCRAQPIGGLGGRGGRDSSIWRFHFNMAEASDVNAASGCEEKGPEGSSPESVPPDTSISRMKLLDTTVDTFLQKLIAAGR